MVKTSADVGRELAAKTLRELSQPREPQSRSRVWQDPKGYQYLAVWQNAALLRVIVRVFTKGLPKGEYRLRAQMDDEARSTKRNIEEGWKRSTTSEYLQFLGYSQGSLEELRGDVRDCKTDGFLKSVLGSTLNDLGIDLRITKGPAKGMSKGEPTDPNHPYYQPLTTLNPEALIPTEGREQGCERSERLTYEISMELINKTDWLLRKLVESLEKKLEEEKKAYQTEQARIKGKLRRK